VLASQYVRALQIGRPKILGAREMGRVIEKFKTYGKQTEVKK
jgi:L-fuculose-phosphate aldolase